MSNGIKPSVAALNARELIAQKDRIESEINDFEEILRGQKVGMHEPLIDNSGYPRDDIDLVAVRTARARIIALRNDHKEIMNKIERALHEIHAENQANGRTEEKNNSSSAETESSRQPRPFAIVNAIAPDSPAKEAGLLKNDKIIRFGSIHAGNHQNLQALTILVSNSEGETLDITIIRGESESEQTLVLKLTPRRGWGGRGLLGCHILPI
ncbi:16034_t:CDS:2 [Acaulospora morrowiae]|uniref:Probable 26S proteasome regulatory subunit p27 n=1 Tax=Acaulospora morrowiae TaxID=94023 RepID=A0A9N9G1E7_9GLOM|nr:16034_t:CDS:2 [Acaulospora morrowiae]